jgi:hypothetical protein
MTPRSCTRAARVEMARRVSAATVAALVLALVPLACTRVQPVVSPQAWDEHGDSGPLRVHGARDGAPGPRIYRALARRPELRELLREQGEPDTLEVIGGRWQPKRVVLDYRRRSVGRPRRIYLEATSDGFVASAPQSLSPRRRAGGSERPRTITGTRDAEAATPPLADQQTPTPTAAQQLECPIDRQRPDCRAYCTVAATHEWCR